VDTMELPKRTKLSIDAFLAEQCGWEYEEAGFSNYSWMQVTRPDGRVVGNFTQSLDALFASGGPVELCRKRGWVCYVGNGLDPERWCAHMGRTDAFKRGREQGEADVCLADSPASALAEACARALGWEGGDAS